MGPSYTLSSVLSCASLICLSACTLASDSASLRAPSQVAEAPADKADEDSPATVGVADLIDLAEEVDPSNALDEAATISMMAFREQFYLPFRSGVSALVDSSGIQARAAWDGLFARFQRLGDAGQDMLERCVQEAWSGTIGSVHLLGDDAALFGRTCLDTMAAVYGRRALPFLIDVAGTDGDSSMQVLLRRAALGAIRTVAEAAQIDAVSPSGGWEDEVLRWRGWLKSHATASWRVDPSPTACEPQACAEESMGGWVRFAARHVAGQGNLEVEARYLIALRAYLHRHADHWLPWLESRSSQVLASQTFDSLGEAGLLFELWAETAAHTDADYFNDVVVPTLASAIDPGATDALAQADRGVLILTPAQAKSRLAVRALERATGMTLMTPACNSPVQDPGTIRSCLEAQARFWRSHAHLIVMGQL